MYKIANLPETDRRVLFINTAEKTGIHPAIIEKDFWVCVILKFIFEESEWKDNLIFKGGTSLSKAFHAIERFSEDIDLILEWEAINYSKDEPWKERSRTQQDRFNKRMNADTQVFLETIFVPEVKKKLLVEKDINLDIRMDRQDEQVVDIYYPQIFEEPYLRSEIRLEIGPLAEGIPSHHVSITPFVAEQYINSFKDATANVLTVDSERTFWEKTTILHKVANRDIAKPFPVRYARHYYDLYCLSRLPIKEAAFNKRELLAQDVRFKHKFYYSRNAGYDTADLRNIKLIPRKEDIEALKTDYEHMKNMIYGDIPDFDSLMTQIRELEEEIHGLY